jgi:hypothetical protein
MFNKIKEVSQTIGDTSHPATKVFKASEEFGEYITEMGIHHGFISNKKPSSDGPIGEAADVMITTLDMLIRTFPELTQEEFEKILDSKLNKWKRIYGKTE